MFPVKIGKTKIDYLRKMNTIIKTTDASYYHDIQLFYLLETTFTTACKSSLSAYKLKINLNRDLIFIPYILCVLKAMHKGLKYLSSFLTSLKFYIFKICQDYQIEG